MERQEWLELLTEINHEMMSDEQFVAGELVTAEQRQTRWLGQPGASEVEIMQLEQRLGCQLPP